MPTLITVYQPVAYDSKGRTVCFDIYLLSEEETEKHCHPLKPIKKQAVLADNGKVFLISGPIDVYSSYEEMEKELALKKLTEREKELLGLK